MNWALLDGDSGTKHNEFADLSESIHMIDNALQIARHELGRIAQIRDDLYYVVMHEPENK